MNNEGSDNKNKESILVRHTHTHTHTQTAIYPQRRIQHIAALDSIWHQMEAIPWS